jgi:hypothetical protein
VGVGLMLGAWSFATPIGAAPDEPDHTAQAVAIVRGEFNEPEQPLGPDLFAFVRVPCWVDNPWLRSKVSGCIGVPPATTGFAATQYSNAAPPNWSPPGGEIPVQVVFVVGAIVTLALVVVMISGAGDQLLTANAESELAGRREDATTSG